MLGKHQEEVFRKKQEDDKAKLFFEDQTF